MKKTLSLICFIALAITAHAQQQADPKKREEPTVEKQQPIAVSDSTFIFHSVEKEPSFPGGISKWLDYIKTHLKYPDVAKANHIQGKVFVSFIVERDGSLTDPKVLRGIGSGCDEEAIRLIKSSPKWEPGTQNGRVVRVFYPMPISFTLAGQ